MTINELSDLIALLKTQGVSHYKQDGLDITIDLYYSVRKSHQDALASPKSPEKPSEPKLYFEMSPEELPE